MKKLCFLSVITLAMMMAMQPQHTKAQNPWDGSYAPWTHGSGTQADPYLIENTWNLAWLAHQVNDSAYTYNGQYFRLTTDLDMNSLEWTPIGNSTTNCFRGNFDGDGHFIDNVYILSKKVNGTEVNSTYAGLFGVINNAIIMSLGVNTTVNATDRTYPTYTGGIVAYVQGNANTLSNCYHLGNISFVGNTNSSDYFCDKTKGYCGGIVGYVNGETTFNNCKNYGQIRDIHRNSSLISWSSTCSLGGLIGKVNANVTILDCTNSAVVYGISGYSNSINHYAGGLIGESENGTITIINSQNNGNINAGECGGLIGKSSNVLNISNSYNAGSISGSGNGSKGGLVGLSTGSCSVTNCYNMGTLSGGYSQGGVIGAATGNISLLHSFNKGSLNISHIYGVQSGGIIGECYSTGMATISCCANSGNVMFTLNLSSNASSDANAYSGGIVGYANYPVTIDRCYNIASISGSGTDANGYHVYKYVGGLVGYFSAAGNNIHECYNTGTVSTGANATYNKCGGILGYNNGGGTSITNCYNVGTLSGGSPKGIVDYNSNTSAITTISNCYYLESCGGSSQTGAVAASSTLMKSPSFPYMLNDGVNAFTVDGNPNVNQGYPIFGDMVYAVSTQNATNVGVTRATLNGNYVGGADTVGFQYRENTTGSTWSTVYASIGSPVSYLLTGLQSNTSYVFRFMAINNGGAYYGEEKTFTTGTCNLTASVSPSSVTLCQGEVATVTASGQSSMGNQFSYSWNTGETTPTISVISGGERVVTVSDSNGCTATASVNVTVHPLPNVAISGNTTLCAGASNTLTASGGSSYVWNTASNTPSITVNNGGTYSVTATNSYGCSSSASVSVTSIENVTISGNLNLCQGQSTTLYANGTGTYQWNTGASTPSITVTQAGPYSVTVSGGGCTSNASVTVSVAPNPTPTILGNTVICQNETTTLTANGGNSYSWSNGITGNSISVSQSGVYAVTATNVEGCSATANVTVTVNPLPNVSISGNNSICQGDNVTLTATGANTYAWSNATSNAAITVSSAGTYTVTGTDANGCSSIATKTVSMNPTYNVPLTHSICQGESYNFYGQNLTTAGTYTHTLQTVNGCDSVLTLTLTVKNLPTPTITGNTSFCQGQSTTLTANGGNSYVWSNTSTSNNINVSQSGVYTVTATNAEGCSAQASVTVTVNPLPTVTINGNSTICQGSNTVLTATGANTYAWSNTTSNAAITVNNAGTYTVTGTDANGCSSTATKTVSVNPTYNVPLTHSICQGESYNFYGQNLTTAGTYTHTLQTVNGCDSVLTLTFTVKSLPTPTITGNTTFCQGQSSTLTATGGNSYVWSNASTGNSISVSQSGVYTVTATNVEGCSATANVTVTVNPLPMVTISGNSTICQGSSTTLTASGANTYAWSNTTSNAAIIVNSAGTYTVTGTDANGCSSIATKTVSVNPTYNVPLTHSICQGESYNFYGQNLTTAGTYTHTLQTVNGCDSVLTLTFTVKSLPTPTITGNTTFCQGQSSTLTATGGNSYVWSNASTGNSISVSQSGVYTVTATNVEGCSATANVTVTVNPLPTVTINGNSTICQGSSTTLTASGANTYMWSTGDNTASVTISAFGVYTVTGTSTEGCSNTANVTVIVSQLPVITITGETDICAGESTILTANGGDSYLWSDGTTANTLTVTMAGNYQVIGYNAAGCSSMADATVSVWQPATNEFTISCPDSCYVWNDQTYCSSGDYTQTLQTVHGCDSMVTLHLTITVGIDDHNTFDFKVYPNPTNGIVNVQLTMNNDQLGNTEIQVFDIYGKLLDIVETCHGASLQTGTGSSTQTPIDLSHYANGVYFIKAVADGNVIGVRKVVKQ